MSEKSIVLSDQEKPIETFLKSLIFESLCKNFTPLFSVFKKLIDEMN
jgi:hypothetical protein